MNLPQAGETPPGNEILWRLSLPAEVRLNFILAQGNFFFFERIFEDSSGDCDFRKLSGNSHIISFTRQYFFRLSSFFYHRLYNRLLRMLGKDMVERLVQDDIRIQEELEAKKRKEQMPKKIGDRIQWARERSEEHNAQIKKNKAKYRGMEL